MKSKHQMIADYIKSKGSITKLQAAELFNEYGLGEVIARMRKRGLDIATVMIPRPNRQAYARYTLIE